MSGNQILCIQALYKDLTREEADEIRDVVKSINKLISYYNAAQHRPDINRPIAWALYQTWKEIDDDFEKTDSGRRKK